MDIFIIIYIRVLLIAQKVFDEFTMGIGLYRPISFIILYTYIGLYKNFKKSPVFCVSGDSAYPLSCQMITPFRDNGRLSRHQKRFNTKISSERQAVERAIGHLKGRFRRLRDIDSTDMKHVCFMITAACILHNFCVLCQDDIEDFCYQRPAEAHHQDPNNYPGLYAATQAGIRKRDALFNYMTQFF